MSPFFNPVSVESAALEASHQIRASTTMAVFPGRVHQVRVVNTSGAPVFVQLFDVNSASVPANTTVPTALLGQVAANSSGEFNFTIYGRPFANGLWVATSSTAATLTISGATSWFGVMVS